MNIERSHHFPHTVKYLLFIVKSKHITLDNLRWHINRQPANDIANSARNYVITYTLSNRSVLTWCLLPCVYYTSQAVIINLLNMHTALSGIPRSVCTAIIDMYKPATIQNFQRGVTRTSGRTGRGIFKIKPQTRGRKLLFFNYNCIYFMYYYI